MAKGSGTTRASSSRAANGISNQIVTPSTVAKMEITARDDRDEAFDRMYAQPAGTVTKGTITGGAGDYYELGGKNRQEVKESLDKLKGPDGLRIGYDRFLVASSLSDNVAEIQISTDGLRGGQMTVSLGSEKHYVRYGTPYASDRVDFRNADTIHTSKTPEEAWTYLKRKLMDSYY